MSRSSLRRLRAATLLACSMVGLMLASPVSAGAHAFLIRSVPAPGARLAASPGELRLSFSEPIAGGSARLTVRLLSGGQLALPSPAGQGAVVVQRLPSREHDPRAELDRRAGDCRQIAGTSGRKQGETNDNRPAANASKMLGELTLTVEATSTTMEHRTSGKVPRMRGSARQPGSDQDNGGASFSVPLPRLTAPTAAVLVGIAIAGCGGSKPHSPSNEALSKLDVKLPAPAQLQAATPQFALRDSLGHLVQLSQFRGKAVLLTFIYDHCPDTCPLIVANLHNALLRLGAKASELQIVAVSVDPTGDTPATVKAFLEAHEMTGRMEYLIGTFNELSPVWRAYGVQVQGSPATREVGHSAFLYGITGHGSVLVLYPPTFDPSWAVHDAPLLAAD